jgi:deoxyribonuclease IV
MKIGSHILIGGGLEKSIEVAEMLGCNCFQFFLQNPRSWERRKRLDAELSNFRIKREKSNLSPLVVHMPYLMNLASTERKILLMSQRLLEREMTEAEAIGADFYVVHPGSHKGTGVETGVKNLASSLKPFAGVTPKILLENTAGQGSTIGGSWEDLGYLFETFGNGIGICLDTAHAFEAGYDIRREEVLNEMKKKIGKILGLHNLLLIHANDSASPLGSRLDRHQHISEGYLGKKAFELLVKDEYFGTLPFIIETPKSDATSDKKNLRVLKELGVRYKKLTSGGQMEI